MEIVLHERADAFTVGARPFYARDAARHTVALTVLDAMIEFDEDPGVLLTVQDGAATVGALMCSPGRDALVSGVAPEHAGAVVAALADAGVRLPGVSGPVAAAEAVGAAHLAQHGGELVPAMRKRLFALDVLVPPTGVPGGARFAGTDDVELLGAWRVAFAVEADAPVGVPERPQEGVVKALEMGNGELLWERDGGPVSQGSARRPVAGMSRIGPVYTPPEHRGHGYAAAVTAAAAQWALDAGATRVVLFTDLDNATTNRLYPRLGFRPVHDTVDLSFAP